MSDRPQTRLELYVSQFIKMEPGEVLTRLQNAGIASDNCLTLGDVFEVQRALEWVKNLKGERNACVISFNC